MGDGPMTRESTAQPVHVPNRWPARVISGGQTGVDRAALDVAIEVGIEHGGHCPRGRRAEDGPIAPRYRLTETSSANYAVRTKRNVIDSNATLILYRSALEGGTKLTQQLAQRYGRPCLSVDLSSDPGPDLAREWIARRAIHVLNIAGPRESSATGITLEATQFLRAVLGNIA